MQNKNKKCSAKEHEELDAAYYCQECKVYMCNKCYNFHSKLCQYHHSFKLDNNINEIFTGVCQEKNHNEQLEFYCNDHNKLCCASCLCKIKDKGRGQHKDCNVCTLENIMEDKKNKLNESIKKLEELSNIFNESINELKIMFEKINENKEQLKLKIQKLLTDIRNALNKREDELLLEVDKKYDDLFIKEEIIKESEKIPNNIKILLEKGKKLNKEWNNEKNIIYLMNNCINIEKDIKSIIKLKSDIQNCHI